MKNYAKAFFKITIFLALLFLFSMLSVFTYSLKFTKKKADVAVVLGAGANNNKVSPVFKERLNHAINLRQERIVDFILITGGYAKEAIHSDSWIAKEYVKSKGVNAEKIIIEEKSKTTLFNIYHAKSIMDSLGLQSALIVSDPYHMKRAMSMCKKMNLQASPSPTPTSMYRSRKTKAKFLINQTWNYWVYQLINQHKIPK